MKINRKTKSLKAMMENLESISQQISNGEVSIEESVELYTQAMSLYKAINNKVEKMKIQIENISKDDE